MVQAYVLARSESRHLRGGDDVVAQNSEGLQSEEEPNREGAHPQSLRTDEDDGRTERLAAATVEEATAVDAEDGAGVVTEYR